jgi:cobyrinic acid a,c-diamide synthase
VSAAASSAGKTLLTMALCAVLRDAGLRVRAYKSGPDYVDARLYASILGEPAHNLDLWLDGREGVLRHVAATAAGADILLIEGMMGLFDGDNAGTTSTARLAHTLDASVLSILDASKSSQTVAAVGLGLRTFDPELRHIGTIANRVGGPSHVAALSAACARAGIEVLAAIPRREAYLLPERRLGLDRVAFTQRAAVVEQLARELAEQLDVPALVNAAAARPLDAYAPTPSTARRARIAYAEDSAFWFTYPETLDALRMAGAELIAFSPLHDRDLPAGANALWISGGYPEDHGAALSANHTLRAHIREAIAGGMPTYAECGGLMYLAQTLHTASGSHEMVGAIGGATSMADPKLHLGYRDATVATGSPLDTVGTQIRAHEFHYATSMLAPSAPAYVYATAPEGAVQGNCVASFFHRHFLPGDLAIDRFVAAAAA